MAQYKAIAEFRINLNGGADPVLVKPGTVFDFDGMNVEVMGWDGVVKKGTAPMLNKVIGDWLVEIAPKIVATPVTSDAKVQAPAAKQAVYSAPAVEPQERTDSEGAKIIRQDDDGLAKMIDNYEVQSGLKEKDRFIIIDEDASIVKQTRKTAGESTIRNTSGVQMEDSEIGKKTVVSREQSVAKQTNYNPTVDSSEPKKQPRLVVSDSEGVIVRKSKEKAVFKTEVNENLRVTENASGEVTIEGAVAKETTYEASDPVVISGTSTQAQSVATAKSNPKRAADAKATRMKQVAGDQDGVVVAKVRKDEAPKATADGFVFKLSVGKNVESDGEAVFSSIGDGIEGGEATFSSGGIDVADPSDEGVDIADILNDIE